MMDWIAALPLGWAILLFWCGAIVRSTVTYALGRGIAAGAEHTGLRRYMTGPIYHRAMRFVDRWGPWAIPLCFLTIGLQTAVIASAGVTRMKWRRFLPAALLGSLIWGIVYGTVGMAVFWAVITAALANPWSRLALVLVIAGLVVIVAWRTGGFTRLRAARARRRTRADAAADVGRRGPDGGTSGTGPDPGAQSDTTSDAGR